MSEKLIGLFITLFLGLFIGLGAFITHFVKKKDKFIDFTIALAFSIILLLLFTDIMPESSELLGLKNIGLFIIFIVVGVFLLRILDLFIPDHEEKKMTKKEEKDNLAHIGFVASIALIIHNIIEGMAIYSASVTSIKSGIMIAIGVGCHNIPLGMVIASTISQNNKNKKKTIFIFSSLIFSTFLGGLIMFFLNGASISDTFLGIILSIMIGMLIYICSNELFPRIKKAKNKNMVVLGILTGILITIITCII